MERRELLTTIAAATVLVAGGKVMAQEGKKLETEGVGPGQHRIVPLPFDPRKLNGISEKMIMSHHENNYAGAVKNLNRTEEMLAGLKEPAPFLVGGLRERELTFANSKVLHELYFGNLGGDGKASGSVEKAIAATFGSFASWEAQFKATGAALGGGSGWVTLSYSLHLQQLRIAWSGGHTQALASGVPLLVMDMYEHAYQIDYGAAAAKYVETFFQNVHWDEVGRRLERAQLAATALRA